MATIADLVANVKTWAFGLGYATDREWADREQPFTGSRAWVRVVSASQVLTGSNQTVQLAEVEVTFARRLGAAESYATALAAIHATMASATVVGDWAAMAAVRASPLPELEPERELEKVGQVLAFSIRAQVALEA